MTNDPELDQLFKEARAAMREEKARRETAKAKKPADDLDEAPDTHGIYKNPDNWIATRGVALIQEETQTLLGNFTEYVHKTVPGARRLVKEIVTLPVTHSETVAGTWSPEAPVRPRKPWHEVRNIGCTFVKLWHLDLAAMSVQLACHFGEGRLMRVELASRVLFGSADSSYMLFLPEGTDIMNELTPKAVEALLVQLELA